MILGGLIVEIWLVSLALCISDDCYNYETIFRCEKVKGEFEDNGTEYIQTDVIKWSRKFIPKDITVKKPSGQYLAVKGLAYQPNNKELKAIKSEMQRILNDYIKEERDRYLHDIERKFEGLFNE